MIRFFAGPCGTLTAVFRLWGKTGHDRIRHSTGSALSARVWYFFDGKEAYSTRNAIIQYIKLYK